MAAPLCILKGLGDPDLSCLWGCGVVGEPRVPVGPNRGADPPMQRGGQPPYWHFHPRESSLA